MVILQLFHAFIIVITLLKDTIYNIYTSTIMKMVITATGYLRSTYTHTSRSTSFMHWLSSSNNNLENIYYIYTSIMDMAIGDSSRVISK